MCMFGWNYEHKNDIWIDSLILFSLHANKSEFISILLVVKCFERGFGWLIVTTGLFGGEKCIRIYWTKHKTSNHYHIWLIILVFWRLSLTPSGIHLNRLHGWRTSAVKWFYEYNLFTFGSIPSSDLCECGYFSFVVIMDIYYDKRVVLF